MEGEMSVHPFDAATGVSAGPRVGDHYERRFAIGRPFEGGPARAGGWIRLLRPRPADHLLTTALADIWMPAVLVSLPSVVPSTTVELTIDYLAAADGVA